MMNRTLHIHAFCSVKGGVGKSTLAVSCATRLARPDQAVVLIDADMTGSSLADGLALEAPRVALKPDGQMDLEAAASTGFYSAEESQALRDQRQGAPRERSQPPPPFFNDALTSLTPPSGAALRAMLWRHAEVPLLRVLPASPLRADAAIAVGWLYREEHLLWAERLGQIIYALAQAQPDLTDVVLDLPPGLYGFAQAALALLVALCAKDVPRELPRFVDLGIALQVNPLLVTTPDHNALVVSLEEFLRLRPQLPALKLLANRAASRREIVESLGRRFGATLKILDLDQEILVLEEHPALGRLFRREGALPAQTINLMDPLLRRGAR